MNAELPALALKDMDPALLAFAILREGAQAGVDVEGLRPALELAAFLHRDDVRGARKGFPVDPYVTHPFRLVLRLLRYGCRDQAVLAAAALHDTMEDHPDELVEVLGGADAFAAVTRGFGPDVARIVAAVTNGPGDYLAHVTAAVAADPQAFLVKLSDFVDNAGSLQYLADEARRTRLTAKYAPLIPVLTAALDQHRPALGLDAHGLAQIQQHLTQISARLAPP